MGLSSRLGRRPASLRFPDRLVRAGDGCFGQARELIAELLGRPDRGTSIIGSQSPPVPFDGLRRLPRLTPGPPERLCHSAVVPPELPEPEVQVADLVLHHRSVDARPGSLHGQGLQREVQIER